MNCLLISEIYYFSLLLPQWYLLVETYHWCLSSFDFIHKSYQAHTFLKKYKRKKKELKASHPLYWGLTEEWCKWSPVGCWLSHKNLRLLINTVEAKNEIIVLFMSLVASMSSSTSTLQSQFWTAFLIRQVSVNEDLSSLHNPKDVMPPNTSINFFFKL